MTPILAQSLTLTTSWIIVTLLGLLWVTLGIYWGRQSQNAEGFMLAGRNVGLSLGAATAMATWVTSNTMMVAPVLALEKGVWGMLAYSSAALGLILFAPLALRIKRLLPNGFTAGDFFRQRYGNLGWILFLIITLLYSITWLVTMAIAGGKLLEALGGIPYAQGMTLILGVCVLYTLFGGLYAVIGTDFIQSLIILIGVVIVGVAVLTQLDLNTTYQHLAVHQPSLLDLLMPVALLAFFNNMLFGFGEVFHNNVWWSRAFAMRQKTAAKAFFISGILWLPIPIAAGFIALSAAPLGINVTDASQVGPIVAEHVLSSLGFGLLPGILILIVLFCSIASSIDSLLAATSDLLIKDLYLGVIAEDSPSPKNFRLAATIAILSISFLAWLLALSGWNVASVLYSAGGLVAALIWPVIAGLYWKKINRPILLVGIVVSCLTGYLTYFLFEPYLAALTAAFVSMFFTFLARLYKPQSFPTPA